MAFGNQVRNPYTWGNGMEATPGNPDTWKYCYNKAACEDWCYARRNATPACAGVTTHSNNPNFYFPVTTITDTEAVASASISSLDCSDTSADTPAPTRSPTDSPTDSPTPTPTKSPVQAPTDPPVDPPASFIAGDNRGCPTGFERILSSTTTWQECRDTV